MKIDVGFAADLVRKSLQKGADLAEVYVRAERGLTVEVKQQKVDALVSSSGFGYALRLVRSGRLGFSYATDLSQAGSAMDEALSAATHSDADEFLDMPDADTPGEVEIRDPALEGLPEEDAIRLVMDLESAVYAEDPRVVRVRKAMGSFVVTQTAVVNSRSVRASYGSTLCTAQVNAVAEDGGESQIGWDYSGSRRLADVSFTAVGRKAARRAAALLGARRISGCKGFAVLDSSVASDFLGIFAASISAEAVQKGKSLLAGKRGQRVLSPILDVIDSGLLPWKTGSRPLDAEGVPTRETVVVRGGVLSAYLHNTYTAGKAGETTTGNAVRGGIGSVPSVGVTNLFIGPSAGSRAVTQDALMAGIDRGILVTDAMGVHTANPVSGDFSVGVTGMWVEDGTVRYPVREAVISGNILELLGRVEGIGDDLTFYGGIGAPSILVSGVDISG